MPTLESSREPLAGVTSFMLTTCSSTGGMVAPDPWLPTWVKPPMLCSLMLAKFCSVKPCGRNASTTYSILVAVNDGSTAQYSTAQRSAAQRSSAQHSTAQHGAGPRSMAQHSGTPWQQLHCQEGRLGCACVCAGPVS